MFTPEAAQRGPELCRAVQSCAKLKRSGVGQSHAPVRQPGGPDAATFGALINGAAEPAARKGSAGDPLIDIGSLNLPHLAFVSVPLMHSLRLGDAGVSARHELARVRLRSLRASDAGGECAGLVRAGLARASLVKNELVAGGRLVEKSMAGGWHTLGWQTQRPPPTAD